MKRITTMAMFVLMTSLSVSGCVVIPIPGSEHVVSAAPADSEAIQQVLATQAQAWNRGDIDGFMQGYWHSDQLRFASGDSATYGWQATLDRYHAHYPDRAAMGQLAFSDLTIELLAPDAAVVFGHWSLVRDIKPPHGVFTLVFRKIAGEWKITRDHTSAAAQ